MNYSFHPEAEVEFTEAIEYYEEKYSFPEIPTEDLFYVEDIPKFYKKRVEWENNNSASIRTKG